jgi:hypothetical protein
LCANQGQIIILWKFWNSHNSRFLHSWIVHIRNTKFFIILESKFKWYVFENCHFHIELVIPRSGIIMILSIFCLHSVISPIPGFNFNLFMKFIYLCSGILVIVGWFKLSSNLFTFYIWHFNKDLKSFFRYNFTQKIKLFLFFA